MAYLSQTDVEIRVGGAARLIELLDDDQDGMLDAASLVSFLDDIDAEVNTYLLSSGHVVPIAAEVFAPIKTNVLDLVNYRLKTRGDRQCSDDDRNLFKTAITFLNRVARNEVVLAMLPEFRAPFALDSNPPFFSRETLRKW